jgi:hypothetical protein
MTDDLSRSLIAFEQNSTMVVMLEMSQSSWLAAGVVPGIERRPLKKLNPDPTALLRLLQFSVCLAPAYFLLMRLTRIAHHRPPGMKRGERDHLLPSEPVAREVSPNH